MKLFSPIFLLWFCVLSSCSNESGQQDAEVDNLATSADASNEVSSVAPEFDAILTEEFFSENLGKDHTFTVRQSVEDENAVWFVNFDSEETDEGTHAFVKVTVGRGGSLLTEDVFNQARKTAKANLHKTDLPMELFFPSIGARAWYGWGIGPNGGGDSCVATTQDLAYDVEVSQGNHLSAESSFQSKSVISLTETVIGLYMETQKAPLLLDDSAVGIPAVLEIDDSFQFPFLHFDFLDVETPSPGWQIALALLSDEPRISDLAFQIVRSRHSHLMKNCRNVEDMMPLFWSLEPRELTELDKELKRQRWYISP